MRVIAMFVNLVKWILQWPERHRLPRMCTSQFHSEDNGYLDSRIDSRICEITFVTRHTLYELNQVMSIH